jgi:hypothetical protein
MPTRCNRCFLLQILLFAQHVSGTNMPIIRSYIVLYSWFLPVVFGAWFSSCRYGVELRVWSLFRDMICTLISAFFERNRIGEEQFLHQPESLPALDRTRRCVIVSTWAPSRPYFELLDFSPRLKALLPCDTPDNCNAVHW